MVYGRRIFHAPTKGQKSAERNDPLPLGNNFQDPVLPLEASRMGRWIWKKFLNISSVSNPFPRKGMRASGRRTWLSQTFFFAPTSRSLIQDISPLRSVVQVVCKFRGGKNLASSSRLGKSISFRPCVFSTSPFSPSRVLSRFLLLLLLLLLSSHHPSYFFSFDYISLLHRRRHYAVVLLRLITVYCSRVVVA